MSIIRQSFKRQLFTVLMAVTLLMLIIGGILTIQGFQMKLKSDYEKRDIEQNSVIRAQLNLDFKLSEGVLKKISQSDVIINALTSTKNSSLKVYSELFEITGDVRDFAEVDLFQGNRCVYSTGSRPFAEKLPLNYGILRQASDDTGKIVYALASNNSSRSGSALLIAQKIVSGTIPGFAVIKIERTDINTRLQGKLNAQDGFMLTNNFLSPLCLLGTAADGKVLATIRSNLFNGNLYNSGIADNVYISEIGETGLLSIYITPPVLGESAVKTGYQILLIQSVISIIVCFLVASRLSVHFSKPINTLAMAMKRFRNGDFDTRIELSRADEFQQLAGGFNKMTTQLKQTMEERVEAERTINETRIQMMQAQLNPHFLYNTLDTIKWVGKANNVPEVATMSASLAGILRTSISGKQFCKLSKELELIQNYCEIQKIRFDDKFDLTIDVPDEVCEAVIPKLILQPIVENAIIHGMDETENGHIYVAALRDRNNGKDLLKISVQDDGKGISNEMMQALNNDDVETLKGHLGLNNVNTIIRLYYGKEYGVMAFRPSEGGTVMIVTLPYSEKEPEKDGDKKSDDQSNDRG